MKDRLVLITFLLCFSIFTFGQTYIGFKAGINYSETNLIFNIQPTDAIKRVGHPGLHLSVPLEVRINDILLFQPELTYTAEGATIFVLRMEEERVYNNVLDYLKLPLLAKVQLFATNQFQINLLGGITPAFAVGIRSTSFPQNFGPSREEPASFVDNHINRFNMELNAGMNVEKHIAKGLKMLLEARYNLGVYDIDDTEERTTFIEGVYLSLGLLIPLKDNS